MYHTLIRRIRDKIYYLKCYFFKKYNRIVVRSLPPTWIDRDTFLEHACFQILCDFIELEKPSEHFDIELSNDKEDWKELFELYRWWKNDYLKFDAWTGYESLPKPKERITRTKDGYYQFNSSPEEDVFARKAMKKEEEMYNMLTQNMQRLVSLRYLLWT